MSLNVSETIKLMYSCNYYLFYCYAKMFKASIIKKFYCYFDESVYYSEDKLFIIKYLSKCTGKVYYSSVPVYKYIQRDSGAMASMNAGFNKKAITAYYASLQILSILRSGFCSSENIRYARKEVYTSYRKMMERLDNYKINDDNLKIELRTLLISSIGRYNLVKYSMSFAIKELIRKIIN